MPYGEKVTQVRRKSYHSEGNFVEKVALKNFPSNDRVRETIVLKNIYKTILP